MQDAGEPRKQQRERHAQPIVNAKVVSATSCTVVQSARLIRLTCSSIRAVATQKATTSSIPRKPITSHVANRSEDVGAENDDTYQQSWGDWAVGECPVVERSATRIVGSVDDEEAQRIRAAMPLSPNGLELPLILTNVLLPRLRCSALCSLAARWKLTSGQGRISSRTPAIRKSGASGNATAHEWPGAPPPQKGRQSARYARPDRGAPAPGRPVTARVAARTDS